MSEGLLLRRQRLCRCWCLARPPLHRFVKDALTNYSSSCASFFVEAHVLSKELPTTEVSSLPTSSSFPLTTILPLPFRLEHSPALESQSSGPRRQVVVPMKHFLCFERCCTKSLVSALLTSSEATLSSKSEKAEFLHEMFVLNLV